jgi:hypothetical protein
MYKNVTADDGTTGPCYFNSMYGVYWYKKQKMLKLTITSTSNNSDPLWITVADFNNDNHTGMTVNKGNTINLYIY